MDLLLSKIDRNSPKPNCAPFSAMIPMSRPSLNAEFKEVWSDGEIFRDDVVSVRAVVLRQGVKEPESPPPVLRAQDDLLLSRMFGPDAIAEEYALRGHEALQREKEESKADNAASEEHEERQSKRSRLEVISERLAVTRSHSDVLCLYVETAPRPGKFDPQKAAQLKIPKGPAYTKLVKGEPVTLEDGRVIRAEDCVGPQRPGALVLVVRCDTQEQLSLLLLNEGLKPRPGEVSCVFHQVTIQVLRDSRYCGWARGFGMATEHVLLCSEVCPQRFVFTSPAIIQSVLSSVDPSLFPTPFRRDLPTEKVSVGGDLKVIAGQLLLQYNFHKLPGFDSFQGQDLNEEQALMESISAMQSSEYRALKSKFSKYFACITPFRFTLSV